jgi:repressor LexA
MVVERILQIIEYKGINKRKFYLETGLSNGFLDKVKDIGASKIENILNIYPDINPEWILTGNGPMLKPNVKDTLHNKNVRKSVRFLEETKSKENLTLSEGIPLIPIDAMAGFGNGSVQIMDYDTQRYIVPEFTELHVDFMIRVKGSSMYPKYNSGDLVACKKLFLSDLFFQWNKVYVLDTEQGALIKRIKKGSDENHILIISDNKSYEPFEIPLTKINAIALVVGVIRLE